MKKSLCITIDLESDFAGLIPESYNSCDLVHLDPFFELVRKYNVKLTVFVVGVLIEKRLPILKKLQEIGAEFALHSYTHNLMAPDTIEEIQRGKKAFKEYFGVDPIGYRAPQGRISNEGMKRLEKEGFVYDASVFPSFWPAWGYIFYSQTPCIQKGSSLIEIPFATFPFRLIISLSWIKLLGWFPYRLFFSLFSLPQIFVFDSHLHDYMPSGTSYKKMSPIWKCIYRRNYKMGLKLFERFLLSMQRKGYKLTYMSEVCNDIKNTLHV